MNTPDSTKTPIAFLGTGLMGRPMAERLLAQDYPVTAYNRTIAKAEELNIAGATVAESPAQAIRVSDCVILMLSDGPAVRNVILSERARSELTGKTVIQMSTISSQESRWIARQVWDLGGDYLEAPVLGSIPQVRSGTLMILVGATAGLFTKWSGLLQCIGPKIRHIGGVGQAAALKLAFNQLIASLTAGFSLSLGIVQQSNIEVETFMEILRDSALYAPTFEKKLSRMLSRDFDNPNFPLRLLLKDVTLILEEAQGLDISSLEGIRNLVAAGMTETLADADYSALYELIVPKR